MKHIYLLSFIIVLACASFQSCQKDPEPVPDPELQYREIAWQAIGGYGQSITTSDWKKAPVTYGHYGGRDVVYVTLNISVQAGPGVIIVMISKASRKALSLETRF